MKNRLNFLGVTEGLRLSFPPSRSEDAGFREGDNERSCSDIGGP